MISYLREWRNKKKKDVEWVKRERARRNEAKREFRDRLTEQQKHDEYIRYRNRYFPQQKLKLIEMLGGKCESCGYNRYYGSLDIHETEPIDPQGREPSALLRTKKGFELLVKNLNKLRLRCRNCHTELHNGFVSS